ncbi:MAG: permease-like cell division protein FtsX [Oscillospiraceae bacterium]|nr:permease-like cell division protein FtsX [Oscillospiraceae bacterium]
MKTSNIFLRASNVFYFLQEAVHNIFLHGLMSLAAVGVTMACLLIMGSFTLVSMNLNATLSDLERENVVIAYIDETYSEEQARALEADIMALDNVESCKFVTREEAMEAFVSQYDDDSVFASVPASVLRDRFEIHLTELEEMESTVIALKAVEGVANVRAELEIAQGFMAVRNMAGVVAIILAVMLLLVSLFIISNTIRLGAYTRRDEVAIIKMCGAKDSFIRCPFVAEGVILGLVGAVIAFFIQWGVYNLVMRAITKSDTMQLLTVIPFHNFAGRILLIFLLVGLAVGAVGSSLAINKFLKV